MYWQSHVKLLDAAKYRTGLMFRRVQNVKPGHTNLLILKRPYDSYRIVAIYKQTRTIKDTCDTGYMYMDLSFLVYFPLSNLKLNLILVFVMFLYRSKSIKGI